MAEIIPFPVGRIRRRPDPDRRINRPDRDPNPRLPGYPDRREHLALYIRSLLDEARRRE